MIVFISPYPTIENEKEGMMQRVKAIDKIFFAYERNYVQFTINYTEEPIIDKISELVLTSQVNLLSKDHRGFLMDIIEQASMVYVHSIYNAIHVLQFYKYCNIITDMHGVVPEELRLNGQIEKAMYFEKVERFVVENSYKIVNVTNSMSRHFETKYGNVLKNKMLYLPIFDQYDIEEPKTINNVKRHVIYSGGNQKWQNIDMMFNCIKKVKENFSFIVLSKDIKSFKNKAKRFGLSGFIVLNSVPWDEVKNYYQIADFGFILRDDIVVNHVACPTKLSEYLSYGVIPIVKCERIGDFKEMGYKYIKYEDFCDNKPITKEQILYMREENYKISQMMKQSFEKNSIELIKLINHRAQRIKNGTISIRKDEIMLLSGSICYAEEQLFLILCSRSYRIGKYISSIAKKIFMIKDR